VPPVCLQSLHAICKDLTPPAYTLFLQQVFFSVSLSEADLSYDDVYLAFTISSRTLLANMFIENSSLTAAT